MDSKVRRLATEVEDRPIETIPLPEKNAKYIDEINHSEIWDQGAWKSLDLHPLETLKQGHLNFELQGVK